MARTAHRPNTARRFSLNIGNVTLVGTLVAMAAFKLVPPSPSADVDLSAFYASSDAQMQPAKHRRAESHRTILARFDTIMAQR